MKKRITFLGLGTMGRAIATNLLAAGHELTVWNRTKAKCDEFIQRGATGADAPASAVKEADVIMYCLGSERAVDQVVFGSRGILEGARAGQVAIDLATGHPALSRRQAQAYAERGVAFLDISAFGSKPEAEAGALWLVAGGDAEVLESVRPLLNKLSQSVEHMGGHGMGASMGLIGSLIVGLQLEALSEAMVLAVKAGLDARQVLEIIAMPDFRSPIFSGMGAGIVRRDFSPMFSLKHMQKDADGVARLAQELNVPIPGSAVVREVIKAAVNRGYGEENASALIKAIEEQANVVVR